MLKVLTRSILTIFLLLSGVGSAQQLVINEVSQGTTGVKEYVELLVVGSPTCAPVTCMDLRGWYIDDNNGFYASGSGVGIAAGCVRFSQDPMWSCVPIGTLILIYNDADPNSSVPAADLSLSDGNCKLVLPISNCTLFERHTTQPGGGISTFPTSGFISCGSWQNLSMANGGDSFQVVDPANTSSAAFAVSWANNQQNQMIYFMVTMNASVMYMANLVDDDPFNQANWTYGPVPAEETPGSPNNAANAAWISTLNNNCQPRIPLTATGTSTDAGCGCTGSMTVTPSGGIQPYTYSWTGTSETDSAASNLCPGNYSVIITGANGCTDTVTSTISQAGQITININKTDVTCNGLDNGSASVTTNSSGTLSYSWDPPVSTGATASALSPGTYTVTVSEQGGCDYEQTFIITEPQPVTLQTASFDVTCFGSCNGQGVVVPAGGTSPYSFSWNQTGSTQPADNNLCAGQHCVEVTDSRGCSANACVTITQPDLLVLDESSVAATCNRADGSASVAVSGGIANYTYSWSNGGQSSSITNVSPGSYCVEVTDMKGCKDTVCVAVANTPGVSFGPSTVTNASCKDSCNGNIQLSSSGGNSPYTYSWQGSSNSGDQLSTACAGTYTIVVTDNIGCKDTTNATVTEPAYVNADPVIPATICIGQSVTLSTNATGGTGPYTYSYSPAGPTVSPDSTTTYSVIAIDDNGCRSTAEPITVPVHDEINADIPVPFPVCPGGSLTLSPTISGGDGNYSYQWLPGNETTASLNLAPTAPSTYTVIVNDGCTTPVDSAFAVITITPSSTVEFSVSEEEGCLPFCVQLTDSTVGSVSSTWIIGTETMTGPIINFCPSASGAYTVILNVQGANGCSGTDTIVDLIKAYDKPVADFAFSPETVTILNPEVEFENTSTGATQFTWNILDSLFNSSDLQFTFGDTGCYEVKLFATSNDGCVDSTQQLVCIENDFGVYIPNAFTPNGDGMNDKFFPSGFGISTEDFHMSIFNRWGELIFETTDVTKGWDGKSGVTSSPEDVYIWKLRVKDERGDHHSYRGHVTIVK